MIEDPVEILVQMAERGEIDPWHINIIEITDRFFSEMEKQRMLDLRVSGRTLFYAATLLRIKSDFMQTPEEEPEEDLFGEGEFDGYAGDGDEIRRGNPIFALESEIVRRLDRKNMRKQPVTLYDLIAILRNAEKEDRRRQRDSWVKEEMVYAEDIVSIAHEESFHSSAEEVYDQCERSLNNQEVTRLSDIARELGWPLSQVYIPLLFLMHDGRLQIRQESFFGEIFIEREPC